MLAQKNLAAGCQEGSGNPLLELRPAKRLTLHYVRQECDLLQSVPPLTKTHKPHLIATSSRHRARSLDHNPHLMATSSRYCATSDHKPHLIATSSRHRARSLGPTTSCCCRLPLALSGGESQLLGWLGNGGIPNPCCCCCPSICRCGCSSCSCMSSCISDSFCCPFVYSCGSCCPSSHCCDSCGICCPSSHCCGPCSWLSSHGWSC